MGMKKTVIMAVLCLVILAWLGQPASAANHGFGGDTTGAVYGQRADSAYWLDSVTTPSYTGPLDSGLVWLDANYKGPHSVAIIIAEVAGADTSIVDSTAHFSVSINSATRYKAAFIQGATLAANTLYLVGIHFASAGGTNGALKVASNDAIHVKTWYKDAQAVIPPTITAPTTTTVGHIGSTYLFYHDAASVAPPLRRRK
jgi:hypothetical protein